MARPKLEKKYKKLNFLATRLTDLENKEVNEYCIKNKISKTNLIHECVFNRIRNV